MHHSLNPAVPLWAGDQRSTRSTLDLSRSHTPVYLTGISEQHYTLFTFKMHCWCIFVLAQSRVFWEFGEVKVFLKVTPAWIQNRSFGAFHKKRWAHRISTYIQVVKQFLSKAYQCTLSSGFSDKHECRRYWKSISGQGCHVLYKYLGNTWPCRNTHASPFSLLCKCRNSCFAF